MSGAKGGARLQARHALRFFAEPVLRKRETLRFAHGDKGCRAQSDTKIAFFNSLLKSVPKLSPAWGWCRAYFLNIVSFFMSNTLKLSHLILFCQDFLCFAKYKNTEKQKFPRCNIKEIKGEVYSISFFITTANNGQGQNHRWRRYMNSLLPLSCRQTGWQRHRHNHRLRRWLWLPCLLY